MGTLPSRWIPVQYRLTTWSAWRKDGRHSRRWFKWYVDVFGLKTQVVEIQQNGGRDNTALWLLRIISPSSRENKRLLMTCSNRYIHAVPPKTNCLKNGSQHFVCVCVCVYTHTHTHTGYVLCYMSKCLWFPCDWLIDWLILGSGPHSPDAPRP